jgi:ketosteroid isomerase-like protein
VGGGVSVGWIPNLSRPPGQRRASRFARAGVFAKHQRFGGSTMSDKKNIIRAVFAAYIANDRKAVEDALTVDFRFTSPYDDRIDKTTYFLRCWRNTGWIERHELEKILVDGDQAFVTYQCTAKGGKSFRNTEFFGFEGDKIKRIDVYFGATYQNGAFVRQSEN